MPEFVHKLFIFFRREYFRRALPHGLVSPRYFLPFQPRRVRIHRRLWLRALPRVPLPLFLPMEGFLYLRWVLFDAWRFSLRAVRRRGPGIRGREGVGIVTQFVRAVSMAILHVIPLSEIYAFRLYGPDRHTRVWEYVFTHEVPAFHRWRDLIIGKKGRSGQILGDKKHTAEILSQHGVPMVPTLDSLKAGADLDLPNLLTSHRRLFLKPRRGSAGHGCFVVEKDKPGFGLNVFETRAGMIMERVSDAHLFEHMAREPYVVQPMVQNHSDLAALCETRDAVTVRIITEAPQEKPIRSYAAMLEIPGPATDIDSGRILEGKKRFHIILPIDMSSGKAIKWDAGHLLPAPEMAHRKWYKKAENVEVPFWNSMCESAIAAHELFRDIYAVAWDFAVSPEGPLMLEGNTGWGTRMPQMICGGLLRDL